MRVYSCTACSAQYPASDRPPTACPICEDERQYVPGRQDWTTRRQLIDSGHRNVLAPVEQGVTGINIEPKLGIGQRCFLVQTGEGTVLWDCVGLLHPEAVQQVREVLGGGSIDAIAVSHPHFYTAMADWAEAFDCQVWVHEADMEWITRPCDCIQLWSGDEEELMPGCTLLHLGGHFPGSCVLHWDKSQADGKPVLFAGDTIFPAMDRRHVSWMWSFPNYLPLPSKEVRRMADTLKHWEFDRLYGAFPEQVVQPDAKLKVLQSAERYCGILDGTVKRRYH